MYTLFKDKIYITITPQKRGWKRDIKKQNFLYTIVIEVVLILNGLLWIKMVNANLQGNH